MTGVSQLDLIATVSSLPPCDPSTWSTEQAGDAIPTIVALQNQLEAFAFTAIATFDAGDGARADGHRTTGDWLTTKTRMTNAGAKVHIARDLRDVLPATMAALATGNVTAEHVRAIRRARRIFDDFTEIEQTLVAYAKLHTAAELRTLVDLMIQQYQPDGSDEDAEARREKRFLFLSQGLEGWWHLQGLLDPATGEKLKTALDAFSDSCGPDDRRELPARRVDALAELAEMAMEAVDRPTGFGHLTLTLTPEQAESKLGVTWPSGFLASRTDVALQACCAEVTYVVGHKTEVGWQPLAVGFAKRYATPAQRRALEVRDGSGCAHPGCTVAAWRCVAHHIIPWDEGGATILSNLVLLCRYHHRVVHSGKLRVVFQQGRATTEPAGTRAPP